MKAKFLEAINSTVWAYDENAEIGSPKYVSGKDKAADKCVELSKELACGFAQWLHLSDWHPQTPDASLWVNPFDTFESKLTTELFDYWIKNIYNK